MQWISAVRIAGHRARSFRQLEGGIPRSAMDACTRSPEAARGLHPIQQVHMTISGEADQFRACLRGAVVPETSSCSGSPPCPTGSSTISPTEQRRCFDAYVATTSTLLLRGGRRCGEKHVPATTSRFVPEARPRVGPTASASRRLGGSLPATIESTCCRTSPLTVNCSTPPVICVPEKACSQGQRKGDVVGNAI